MSCSTEAKSPARLLLYAFPKIHTQSAHSKCLRPPTSGLFLLERHYLFIVPTFPMEQLKRSPLGSGFPAQNSYVQFLRRAPWHPAWETEGRLVQAPAYTTMTSRKQLFSVGYFQQFRCLSRIKERWKD